MMGTLRSMLLLLLTTTLSHNALGRPQADEEVKIITKPSPGEEYVLIHNGKTVIPAEHPKQVERDAVKGFTTSHKIPSRAASEKSLSPSLTKPENIFSTSHKITRYHTPLVKRSTDSVQQYPDDSEDSNRSALLRVLSQAILTPDQVLPQTEMKLIPQTEEIRTEYSVVTSKPRKVVPTAKHVPIVKIEPKGDSGVTEEKLEGPDVHKVMQKKLNVEQGKESKDTSTEPEKKSDDSLISSVEVKPVSQVGVTSPKFETKEGDISVPLQKMEAASSGKVTTTTVLPLTSTVAGLTKSNFDIIPVNLVTDKMKKGHEKDLDFVDSPLGDKLLVPAGSSSNQQSRIEVKKGPNGQDYEYEYVYYYYDDEDNDTIATAGEKSHVTASPPTTTSTTTERTSTSGKRYLPTVSHKDTTEEANHAASARGRSRNRSQPQGATEQQNHPEHLESKPSNGRQRYTTIERNKGEVSTTVAPESSNEVLPPSRGSRFRGRQLNLQTTTEPSEEPTPVAEERLPSNTRFPPRSRSNHNSATVTTPSSDEALTNRGRSSSGNGGSAATSGVRRPSLELVDSSSFRTHSSDVSRGQDLTSQSPSFPSVLPSGPFRFLGVIPNEESAEKEVKHHSSRVRGRGELGTATTSATVENADTETTSSKRGPHIRRPSTPPLPPELEEADELSDDETTESIPTDGIIGPVSHDVRPSVTELPETDATADENTVSTTEEDTGLTAAMMDKAALDLYAIFQQTQDENASNFVDENATDSSLEDDEEKETITEEGINTTLAVTTTTTSTTTTTTTTTEAPTTTTTTTEAPTTQATGSNRYKSRRIGHHGQNGQNKYRPNGASTSTTTEAAPIETSTRTKGRFGNNRTPIGSGSFGRRGQHKTTPKPAEEEAVKEESKEVASTAPKNNGFPRSRFGTTRSTRVTSTTAATPEAVSTSSGTHAPRPVFADRYNTKRRSGPTRATSAPLSDITKADNSSTEDSSEPAAASEPTAITPRTTGRSRLNIGGGPRPLRPGPKINIGGRPRPGAAPSSVATTQAAPTEPDQEGNEQASHPTTADDTQPEAQEPQETVTTPIPDALTRLRSRPRLHVTGAVKTTSAPAANSNNRRHLVSSLLPKRRPLHPAPETKDSEAAEPHDSDGTDESESPAKQSGSEETQETVEVTATSANEETHDTPRENRLSSLLSGRRRANVARRPGTLLSSTGKQSSQDSA